MRTVATLFPALALLSLCPACTNPEPVPVTAVAAHEAGHGTAQIYDATFDETWKAAHIALQWDQLGTPEDHQSEQYVVTNTHGSAAPSFGDQVGVWFEPAGAKKTRVSVVVMSGTESTAGVNGPDERDVQKDVAKALSFVQSGTPAPQKRP